MRKQVNAHLVKKLTDQAGKWKYKLLAVIKTSYPYIILFSIRTWSKPHEEYRGKMFTEWEVYFSKRSEKWWYHRGPKRNDTYSSLQLQQPDNEVGSNIESKNTLALFFGMFNALTIRDKTCA